MPALSFQEEWLNKLLFGSKQQTTRLQTDRVKVGDVCMIYNQQRRRITDKPLRKLTADGIAAMPMNRYPFPKLGMHYAHFLGKVVITEVCDLYPYDAPLDTVLVDWAHADGFDTFENAGVWFTKRYGEEWDLMHWTVIRWGGWLERYFELEVI